MLVGRQANRFDLTLIFTLEKKYSTCTRMHYKNKVFYNVFRNFYLGMSQKKKKKISLRVDVFLNLFYF
jgi:hypothetical protein